MTRTAHFSDYIGTPWAAGASGPDAFDCMAFFGHVQKNHFGITVPDVLAPDYNNPAALASLFGTHPERGRWSRLSAPAHGCAVIVHRPLHIGTWLDVDGGGVLHCVRGAGVVFTSDSSWPMSGFGRREFFEFAGQAL